jgi:outer membrane protein TolC
MYSVGSAIQQDVLQAQVSVARMTEDLTVMRQERVAMAARLNALLGRFATDNVGELDLPEPSADLPTVDSLMRLALDHRPALKAARERTMAAQAGYRAARRELYPDFMISLSYGQRPQFDDMATLMVGFTLPIWAGSRQLPMRREMRAMESMVDADVLNLRNETFANLVEMRSKAVRSANLAQLYASSIVPQARTAVDAALAAYRVGRVDYMTLLDNQMTASRYQVEQARLAADYQGAVAEIEALVGVAIGGGK